VASFINAVFSEISPIKLRLWMSEILLSSYLAAGFRVRSHRETRQTKPENIPEFFLFQEKYSIFSPITFIFI